MGADAQAVTIAGKAWPRGIARLSAFAAALAVLGLGIVHLRIDSTYADIWQHLAAIRYLANDLVAPPPLFLREAYEVHLYTPFHLAWAAVMAAGGLEIWNVAVAAAIANLILFMIGCHLLARHVINDRRMDFALFATLLVFWGAPAWWSGVYSLAQIVLQAAYPSFFAMSATMILGALYLETSYRRPAWQAGFAVAIAAVFVTHPVTTGFLLLFLAAKALTTLGPRPRLLVSAAWPPAAGLGLGLLWPYFSMPGMILATGAQPDAFGDLIVFYTKPLGQIGPAILGLAALTLLRRSRPSRLLALLLAVLLAVYGLNYVLELSHVLSRVLIYIAFTLQLMWVVWLAHYLRAARGAWVLGAFIVAAVVAAGAQVKIGAAHTYSPIWDLAAGTPLGSHSAAHEYRDLETLGGHLTPPALVMAPPFWGYPLVALSGARIVAPLYDAPTLPDGPGRRADAARFFDPTTPCSARAEILRRRGADHVLIVTSDPSAGAIARCSWPVVAEEGRFALYTVGPGAGP